MLFLGSLVTWLHVALCATAANGVRPYYWHEASDLHEHLINPLVPQYTLLPHYVDRLFSFVLGRPRQPGVGWVKVLHRVAWAWRRRHDVASSACLSFSFSLSLSLHVINYRADTTWSVAEV